MDDASFEHSENRLLGHWFAYRVFYSDVPLSRSHLAVSTKFFGGLSTSFLFACSRLGNLRGSVGADRTSYGAMELVRSILETNRH